MNCYKIRRPCSDFDMLQRLSNCRIIIIIIVFSTFGSKDLIIVICYYYIK